MSLMMMLELDEHASKNMIHDVLTQSGLDICMETDDRIDGNFPRSNMFVSFEVVKNGRLKAEDYSVDWLVGGEVVFTYVISHFDECSAQLHDFLQTLSDDTPWRWVLSFQYESVCAVRDDAGLQWLKQF